jgi:hypothetical protein
MKLRSLIVACNICIVLVLLTAGLWPFKFKFPNNAHRLRNNSGILLMRNNLILERIIPYHRGLLAQCNDSDELTIEILLKPYPATRIWLSNILCFYDDKDPEVFMMAKWKSELILRRRVQRTSEDYAYHEAGVSDALLTDKTVFITVVLAASGTTVYIDGREASVFPGYTLNPMKNDLSGARLIVGNNPHIRVPWEGEVQGLAIYRSALHPGEISRNHGNWRNHDHKSLSRQKDIIALYPMNERSGRIIFNIISGRNNLMIPEHLRAIKKLVLSKPWANYWREMKFYSDIILNISGFIPLGFFLPALFIVCGVKKRCLCYLFPILIGSILSLAIELIQVYMPVRTSSLTDLLCNILGTVLGVVIFHKLYNIYLHKKKKPDKSGFSRT